MRVVNHRCKASFNAAIANYTVIISNSTSEQYLHNLIGLPYLEVKTMSDYGILRIIMRTTFKELQNL